MVLLLSLSCTDPATTLIVYAESQPEQLWGTCGEACARVDLGSACDTADHPINLIFSGHSLPPRYLDATPHQLAAIVACTRPELVVMDTCYGASDDVLGAIANAVPSVLVVAAPFKLPPTGLAYGNQFFDRSRTPAERAAAVTARSGRTLVHLRPDGALVAAARAHVAAFDRTTLVKMLRRKHPNLVRAPLAEGEVLVRVPPERFR